MWPQLLTHSERNKSRAAQAAQVSVIKIPAEVACLGSTGGLQLKEEKSMKEMLNYRMLILKEMKSVNETRGIYWSVY